jgi:LysM repeat protein
MVLCLVVLLAGFGLIYSSDQIMPGVKSAGVDLGGMGLSEATNALAQASFGQSFLVRDGDRSWAVSPAELGVSIDAAATAQAAQDWGRKRGGVSGALRSMVSGVDVEPVLSVDLGQLATYLNTARSSIDLPARNAGVRLVNGQAVAAPAAEGRALNVDATLEQMRLNAAGELADGALDLVMVMTAPAITDATPLVAQANVFLNSPFTVEAFDPVRNEILQWTAPPEIWSEWLTAASTPDNSLALTLDAAGPRAFLEGYNNFADERYIDLDKGTAAMQDAVARNQTTATVRIWHHTTTYTVRPGQTLASIAEEVGIPYPYIQAENSGINTDALSVGQVLTLPSKDVLLPLDPIPNKRIVVSRGQQHLWAYENGQVVFDWVISTGLPTSPTALGIFQVQSHELNAYADQWNLYMPHFMGFYHPGPNMDLMNGFHGFPTRGGGYLLWAGDLGHPVTYGCVLLSLENAETLYNWAQEGVVVEVRAQ